MLFNNLVASGELFKQYAVGIASTDNTPTVFGKTVSIGNGFGWVMGIPLADIWRTACCEKISRAV